MAKLISTETILAAKAGDNIAILEILSHYSAYINAYAKRPVYDEYGNQYLHVDIEIRHKIETALLSQIVNVFDPTIYSSAKEDSAE
jgi:hypothetical protein